MLKAWLLIVGISSAGLLAASCAATPQSMATEAAMIAATQAEGAATQAASNVYTAATQAIENALAGGPITPIPGHKGQQLIINTPEAVFIQEASGQVIIVRKQPLVPKYPNGDPMP
jgi:hypothetical protein